MRNAMNQHDFDFKQAHIDLFFGNWKKWGKKDSDGESGFGKWRHWGKAGSSDEDAECQDKRTGWSDEYPVDSDIELSDEWMERKRPGMYGKEEFSDEEPNEDRWDTDDDDDDDRGGHMMPLPN